MDEWSASYSDQLATGEIACGTNWIGNWMSRSGRCGEEIELAVAGSRTLAVQPEARS
jgi:hypothetical protein